MTGPTTFRYVDIPFEHDRTVAADYIRGFGDVFQAEDGTWYLTSAEAVQFAQRNPAIFSSALAYQKGSGLSVPMIPVAIDPPDHVRFRKILDPMFAPRVVNAMEDDLRRQVAELVDAFADTGRCDAIADLARLYPTQVFLTFFGMRPGDRDQLITWVETMLDNSTTGTDEPTEVRNEAAMRLAGYIKGTIDEKRANPGDDVLSKVLAFEGDDAWTEGELISFCFLFTLAGLDTVSAAIGFLMRRLALDPELRRSVIADPDALGPVIEECLRLEPPAPTNSRRTTQEVEVCGVTIPAGAPVTLTLFAANRDVHAYPHPDDLDLDQGNHGHMTFGGGIHRCLGSHLARRELRLVVEEFHRRIPEYEIAPGADPVVRWPAGTMRLASLPLVFPT